MSGLLLLSVLLVITNEVCLGRITNQFLNIMSTTVIASIISILAVVLPLLGIEVGSEQLTVTAQTILVVLSGLWVWFQRVQRSDVNLAGIRK